MRRAESVESDIDAVYAWAGANRPAALEARRRFGVPPDRSSRDNDELRYSLRSLERYAPWVRHVHLVTPDGPPRWLDTGHPRLRLVTHQAVFPDPSVLPSFNSNAIEANLHRIPGLSARFLYLNDDVFLGAPRRSEDYRTDEGGQVFFLDDPALHTDADSGSVHDRAYACTAALVGGARQPPAGRRLPAHCPQLYETARLARLEASFAEHYDRTRRHRARSPDDWVFRVAYMIDLLEGPDRTRHRAEALRWEPGGYRLVRLRSNPFATLRALRNLDRLRPADFCVNDEMGRFGSRLSSWQLRRFLRRRFPQPSSFERTP